MPTPDNPNPLPLIYLVNDDPATPAVQPITEDGSTIAALGRIGPGPAPLPGDTLLTRLVDGSAGLYELTEVGPCPDTRLPGHWQGQASYIG